MRAASISVLVLGCSLAWACSSANEQDSRPEATDETPAETPALESENAAQAASPPARGLSPQPVFEDTRSAWGGEWQTSSRVTHSTCPKWPIASGSGTTRIIRHNETLFQVERTNGWVAHGVASSDSDELTLERRWTDQDGAPLALTLKLRFAGAKRFVMTTEVVVAPWSGQPKGCETYLEEVGVRN